MRTRIGRYRVARVQVWGIVRTDGRRYPTLRVAGVALTGIGLGQHDHAAGVGQRDRGAEAGDTAANDKEIAAHRRWTAMRPGTRILYSLHPIAERTREALFQTGEDAETSLVCSATFAPLRGASRLDRRTLDSLPTHPAGQAG